MKKLATVVLVCSMAFAPIGCRKSVNSTNPAVIQSAALLDAINTCKTVEDGLKAANDAVEKLEVAEPEYYAKVKPLLRRISSANNTAAQKISIVAKGGTADWKSALIIVGTSVTPSDLTTFGFKNQNSQLLVQSSFAGLIVILNTIPTKYGSN